MNFTHTLTCIFGWMKFSRSKQDSSSCKIFNFLHPCTHKYTLRCTEAHTQTHTHTFTQTIIDYERYKYAHHVLGAEFFELLELLADQQVGFADGCSYPAVHCNTLNILHQLICIHASRASFCWHAWVIPPTFLKWWTVFRGHELVQYT